jgi:hypothetical protein
LKYRNRRPEAAVTSVNLMAGGGVDCPGSPTGAAAQIAAATAAELTKSVNWRVGGFVN